MRAILATVVSLLLAGPTPALSGSGTYRNCDERDWITEYVSANLEIIDSKAFGKNTKMQLNCKNQLTWTLDILDDLPEDIRYQVEGWEENGGTSKKHVQQNKTLCDILAHGDGWSCLLGLAFSQPELGPCCPLHKGTYVLAPYMPDPRDFPPEKPGDKWRLQYKFSGGGKPIAEVNMTVRFTDKECTRSSFSNRKW